MRFVVHTMRMDLDYIIRCNTQQTALLSDIIIKICNVLPPQQSIIKVKWII